MVPLSARQEEGKARPRQHGFQRLNGESTCEVEMTEKERSLPVDATTLVSALARLSIRIVSAPSQSPCLNSSNLA
jgi:hypothetical protein